MARPNCQNLTADGYSQTFIPETGGFPETANVFMRPLAEFVAHYRAASKTKYFEDSLFLSYESFAYLGCVDRV